MNSLFKNMDQLPAYSNLQKAARTPFDLSAPEALNPARMSTYVCRTANFKLLYGTERIDDQTLDLLQELANQSGTVGQFEMMKKGETMNRIEGFASENRQVLHTASRDVFSDTPQNPEASKQAKQELAKLQNFMGDLDSGRITNHLGESFTDLINIGIGGSDLGPRAVYMALKPFSQNNRQVHFISNVDPDDCATVLNGLDLSRTLISVVSKSGTTLETLTNEKLVRKALITAGLEPKNHFIAVTGKNSPMDDQKKYLRSFYMFEYICGRYSVTSMVGGPTLSFALGYDNFIKFLKGAQRIDESANEKDIRRNLPLLLAMLGIWNRNFLKLETLAILPYSQALVRFVAHLQQCDMESNGKSINRQGIQINYQSGPVVWGEPGTNGQHSFYQLLHQGTTIVPCEFIGFRQSQYNEDLVISQTSSQEKLVANLLAQALALAGGKKSSNPNKNFAGNRPCCVMISEKLTPETMGELLAIYENKIAFQGFLWNINSFDQEGVQLGKALANHLMEVIVDGSGEAPVEKALLKSAEFPTQK